MANEATPSKREKLYNNLIGTGKVTEQEIGTKDDFVKSITDNESAKYLYNNLKSKFDEEEIGDENKFVGYLAPDFSGPLPAGAGSLPLPTNPAEFKGFENPLVKDIAPGTSPLKSTVAKPVAEPIENTQQLGGIDSKIESFKKENGDFIQQYEQIRKKIEGDNQAVKYSGREGRVTSFGDFISKAKVSKEERDFYNQNKKKFEELEGSRKAMFIQKDLEQLAANAEKYDPNDSDIKKFVKGLFQTGTLKDFATLGITAISRNLDIGELLYKSNKYPKLITPQEKEAIDVYEKLRKIESQDTDWTYKAGAQLQQMVPTVVSMLVTGGLGAGLRAGIGAALNVGTRTGWTKFGAKLAEGLIFNAPRSLVTPTLGTNFTQNRLQGYDIENGEVTKNENAHSVGGDLWRSAVQNYLEYATEQLGELVPTGMAAKLLGNSKVSSLFAKTFGGLGKAAGSKGYGAIKKVTDLASVQGIPSEVMEEVVNALGSTVLTGSNDIDQLSDPSFYKSIALNTILLGGTFKGAQLATGGVGNRIEKNRVNKEAGKSVAALEGLALNVTDESLANQIKLLSENIKAGAFQDEQGNIENGMVSQSLEEVRKAIQATNIENSDEVLEAATKAVIDGAVKTGAYDGFAAIAESEMGGQFAHKKDPSSVIIGTNREGEQFYMLDRFESGLDKEIHIVRPVNGGETKSVTADEFVDLQILDKKEWLDAWLRTRDALAPIQQAADQQIQAEEKQIQAQNTPITIDEALDTRTFMIGEDKVTVVDATEDGVIAVDDEGNEHIGIQLSDLQRIPVEQPIEQPVSQEVAPVEQPIEAPVEVVPGLEGQNVEAPVAEVPVEKPVPTTKDGSPDYDKMEPDMLVDELSKVFPQERVSGMVLGVINNLQKIREGIQKKTAKGINEEVARIKKIGELDGRIMGLRTSMEKLAPKQAPQVKKPSAELPKASTTIAEKYLAAPKVYGREKTIILANGEKLKGRYVISEAGEFIPSHNPFSFSKTEGFPVNEEGRTVNDRDYEKDEDAQKMVLTRASKFDGRAISNPVIITKDGIVVSGNDRTMAGIIAAQQGTDKDYLDMLGSEADMYGINPEDLKGFKNPRISIELEQDIPYTTETFAKFNKDDKKSQNKVEKAVKVAKTINEGTIRKASTIIDGFDTLGDFYSNEGAIKELVSVLVNDGVIIPEQISEIMDGSSLSAIGKDQVETLLTGAVLNEDSIRLLNREGLKPYRNKIVKSVVSLIENRSLGDYSVMDRVNDGIRLLDVVHNGGFKHVREYVTQPALFGSEEIGPIEAYFAHVLMGKERDFRAAIDGYNALAKMYASGQPDMFSGKVKSKDEVLNDIENDATGDTKQLFELVGNRNNSIRAQRENGGDAGVAPGEDQGKPAQDVRNEGDQPGRGPEPMDEVPVQDRGEQEAPIEQPKAEEQEVPIDPEKQQVDLFKENLAAEEAKVDLEASDKQKEAGNYQKGHIQVQGFNVSIENPKGSVRSGIDENGKPWEITMNNTYGYILGTTGKDADHIDVFLGENPLSDKIFVVDQINKDGSFDEHKIMLAFDDMESAKAAYLSNYEEGWQGLGNITGISVDGFRKWTDNKTRRIKPFAEYKQVKAHPEVIKEEQTADILFRDTPYFYSPTETALSAIKQEKATPEQWKAMLLKNGAKQAEMDWMQFDDFSSNKKSLTRADIQDWIDQNKIEIKEVEKGEYSNRNLEAVKVEPFIYNVVDTKTNEILLERVSQSNADDFIDNAHNGTNTKYSGYTTPGGENYRELLLTMPGEHIMTSAERQEMEGLAMRMNNETNFPEQDLRRYNNLRSKSALYNDNKNLFKSSHFDEPNILAHIRFNERTGKNGERVLFVEEIQSDWAQKGKKEGFKKDKAIYKDLNDLESQLKKTNSDLDETIKEAYKAGLPTGASSTELKMFEEGKVREFYKLDKLLDSVRNNEEYKEITAEIERVQNNAIQLGRKRRMLIAQRDNLEDLIEKETRAVSRKRDSAVPDMPFKKTDQWVNLSLRRMMAYAAENGFDAIAWTTGEMQADRYDLSRQINKIVIVGSEKTDDANKRVALIPNDGITITMNVSNNGNIVGGSFTGRHISDVIGKEIAEKVINAPNNDSIILEGENLKIGGSGMIAFYDNIIPNAANKIGKPFGAQTGTIEIPADEVLYGENKELNQKDLSPEARKLTRKLEAVMEGEGGDYSAEEYVSDMAKLGYQVRFDEFDEEIISLTKVSESEGRYAPVQSIPITDKIREQAAIGMPLFSIIGEKGANALDIADKAGARMNALSVARKMESSGKKAKEILLVTGWQRGADKMWRYELPDILNEKLISKRTEGKYESNFSGEEIYSKELISAYPEIKDVMVKVAINPVNRNRGSYANGVDRSAEGLFDLSPEIEVRAKDIQNAKEILIHEVQHYIQDKEGFAEGGSPAAVFNSWDEGKQEEYKRLTNEYESLKDAADNYGYYTDVLMAIREVRGQLEKLNLQKQYWRLSGEVEARNASNRSKMTEAERRSSLLENTEDVSRKDQIYFQKAKAAEKLLNEATDRARSLSIFGERGVEKLAKIDNGATMLDNLATARLMENNNKAPLEIKQTTGWERGADAKWRFEMPDFELKMPFEEAIKTTEPIAIEDVISDEALFTAYPQLKEFKISFYEGNQMFNQGGSANYQKKIIRIGTLSPLAVPSTARGGAAVFANGNASLKSVLSHEVQHIIQQLEGFERGGNKTTVRDALVKNKVIQLQKNPELAEFTDREKEQIAENEVSRTYDSAYESYIRLGGEVEARNAQHRIKLSDKEKKATLLESTEDVARKYQFIIDEAVYAESDTPSAIHAEALTLAETLNTPVRIISDINEIPASQSRFRQAKGWFDPKTGDIIIVLPNNNSVADIQATILHEVVAHKGLRELLGSKFNSVMEEIFKAMPGYAKADFLAKYGDRVAAAEEYTANMSEKDIEPSTWEKIKAIIRNAFRAIGVNLRMNDGDIAFMLWRSKNKLKNNPTAMETAKDIVDSGEMKERMRSMYQMTPQSAEIARLEAIKKAAVSEKNRLIKSGSDRIGLFGDTKVAPNDMFGGEGFDPSAINGLIKEQEDLIKTTDVKISLLKRNEMSGLIEASGQLRFDNAVNFRDGEQPIEKNIIFESYEKADKFIRENGVFEDSRPKDNWKPGELFSSIIDTPIDSGSGYIRSNGDQSKNKADRVTYVERLLTEQKGLTFVGAPLSGAAKIKSSADIAFLFKNLESAASENVFAVLIDKAGNYKVLYVSSGGTTSSIVELKLITTAAIEFEASSVCLVHNHPSGSLKASRQDHSAHGDLREILGSLGKDIALLDSVIINTDSGKYVTFDDSIYQSQDNEPGVDTYTPGVYQFDRLKLYLPSAERISIANSTDVATYLSKMKRGTTPKLGVITLDRKNQITNYSLYDESISAENLISSIMQDIGKHGEIVIIHSNKDLKKSLIDNINRALKPMNSEVLDVIISKQDPGIISSYKSFANGEISLSEPDGPYSDIRFRDSDGDLFNLDTNKITLTKGERLIESWQDRMVSGTKLIEEIKKRGGKVGHFSNFVTEETRSSSRAKAEMDDFEDNYFKPMIDKVGEWAKKGIKREETELYVMAKHAPERNRVIVSREARDKVLYNLDLELRKIENKRKTATEPAKIAGIDKASQVLRNEIDFINNEKNSALIKMIIENGYDVVFNQGGRGVIPDNLTTLEYMMAVNAQKKIIGSLESISQSELGNNRSGMSDINAAEIVQEFEKRVQPGEITEFWKYVNAATQFSLDKSRKYGLISDETYGATKGMYQHYVPLRSWAEKEKVDYQDIFGSNYLGHEILNSVNKQAEGRTSLADNPFGFIASMAESSVVSGNKNEVRKNAWRLIKNNGDMTDLFLIKNSWEINVADPEDAPMWEETFVPPTQEQLNLGIARPLPPNNTYKWHKTKGELEKHQVPVYIDGNRVVMEFKGTIGPRVAAAINGENVVRWAHTDGIAQFTRVMAALKTSKNPDFMLTNFLRDFFFGNMAYYVRGGNPATLTANLGRSWVAIHKNFTKGKEDPYLKQMYEDFKMNGGQTGYVYMLGEEKYEKKIERMIKRANEVGRISPAIAAKRTFNILNHGLDYLAHMSEDAMRFSVYLTEVERMMKESSITTPTEAIKKQGALAAKDATTNFNRKGRYGSQTNAFYAFFNASIQGTTNYVKLAKENPARFITANLVLMGIRTAFAAWCLSLIGGDDDDEGYAALSDYIKENNFVIPAGGGKFITIPLPHGARAFTNIGPLALEVLSGRRKASKATDDYLRSIVSEVSPLNLVGLDKNAFIIPTNFKEGILTIMPTAIRPLAEVAANIDFMGRPIEKKNFLSTDDDKVPRFQNAYASTNKILVGAAKYLNEFGGGNAERSAGMHINKSGENWTVEESKVWGAFDVSPAYTEHILESYFGGVGRFVNDLYKTAVSATKGEVPAKQNIPVFRRLYQEPYETKAWQNFYEIRKRVLNTDGSIKAAKDVGNQSEYVGLNNAYNIELAMKFDVYNKIIRNIAKNKLALPEDSPLRKQADEAIDGLVKNLDAEIKEIDKRYNRR